MDRRQFLRVPLDVPCFVTLILAGVHLTVLLVDIGRGGLQLSLPPNQAKKENLLGCIVGVKALPEVIRDLPSIAEPLRGQVSWVSPQRCGVRFLEPLTLDDEALARAMSCI